MTITPFRFVLAVCLTALIPLFWFVQVVQERDDARHERDLAQDERDGLREAARISAERLAARDEIDLQRTQELTHERNQNQLLRRAVDAGNQRLLVNATCAASATATSGASGVADAGSAELSPDARSDYFTLRDQLALSRQMILGLQDHVRRVCRR
ncbi:lysis system i-spanin subunit Rz [Pseudomonas sp. NFIX28]|uniref:lysis system i-spanin subunit Rz n=1 Tax=Pseudomonas sp. NFIX28 TaxID=1566235 RepID=UPI00089AF36F|nr:lysis system i-spanin subunit Rz [Pseudomonas sp. NFIX28]SDZ45195.1 prophage endopeptidase [Pseudomonas sp. NFIX28]